MCNFTSWWSGRWRVCVGPRVCGRHWGRPAGIWAGGFQWVHWHSAGTSYYAWRAVGQVNSKIFQLFFISWKHKCFKVKQYLFDLQQKSSIKYPPGESYSVPPWGSGQWGCAIGARAVSSSAGCCSCSRPQLRPCLPPLPSPASCRIKQGQINSSNTHKCTDMGEQCTHTHNIAALHKTHAKIIRISIWLLRHDDALLRLQSHQSKTTAAFVLLGLTVSMLKWDILTALFWH